MAKGRTRDWSLLLVVAAISLLTVSTTDAQQQQHATVSSNPFTDKRVLLFGDSQMGGPFGRHLASRILNEGEANYVRRLHRNGSSIEQWAPRSQMLRRVYRPQIVIVLLGGNGAGRHSHPEFTRALERILEAFEGCQLVWITPPAVVGRAERRLQRNRDLASERIMSVVGSSRSLDSRPETRHSLRGRTRDGVHFTNRGGRRWAFAAYAAIIENLYEQ